MPLVTLVGSLCKTHAILCSKIAGVHDVRTWKFVCFRKIFRFSLHNTRDVASRARGHKSPGAESLRGGQKSQQCHKYFFQNSTFASERPQVRTWVRQTCFLPQAPSNLVTPLQNAHHDCLVKMTKFVHKNTCPSVSNHQSQIFKTKCYWLSKSFDHRKEHEGQKVYYFENKHNFPSPPKKAGVRVETNIPKISKAIIMLVLCPRA